MKGSKRAAQVCRLVNRSGSRRVKTKLLYFISKEDRRNLYVAYHCIPFCIRLKVILHGTLGK